jgi:hypothetical protein
LPTFVHFSKFSNLFEYVFKEITYDFLCVYSDLLFLFSNFINFYLFPLILVRFSKGL